MTRRERLLSVFLGRDEVGVLVTRDDDTLFRFHRRHLDNPQRAVLGLRLEEQPKAQHRAHLRLPPWFSNLLPEGPLREWIAAERGVSAEREAELLAQIGDDLPGAVRVRPATDPPPADDEPRTVVDVERARSADVWRFSLAGMQMKFSSLRAGDRFSAPARGAGGDWIVKLPDPHHRDVPVNEWATMELARRAGMEVPETRLLHRDQVQGVPADRWKRDEDWAFAIRRLHRAPDGSRIHIEDFAQVRGCYPEDKYRGSFETLGALAFRRRDVRSALEFARRLAFLVLVENGDAHLENWSLVYRHPRAPELSPAYDLVATGLYRPPHEPEDLGLKSEGSRRFETVRLRRFAALQRRLGVEGVSFEDAAAKVVERALAALPDVVARLGDSWLGPALTALVRRNAARLRS